MDNAFGKRLKILRKEHHITQVQLAERMDQTESNIRNYELGKAFPRIPGLMVLSEMFGVSTDFLLGLSDVRDGNRKRVSLRASTATMRGVFPQK